jgi:hypothetical protein
MLLDVPSAIDKYFDLAEHLVLRSSLLTFLLLALYRLIRGEWRRR